MDYEKYVSREWKSVSNSPPTPETHNGGYDCNICLDFAHEPVVTLCGHLYCWPCIYKWLHVQTTSLTSIEQPQCPVCKSNISHTTMVPLYGRDQTPNASPIHGMAIPPRPSAYGSQTLVSSTPQNHNYNSGPPSFNLAVTGLDHRFVGMFGEMVYARVFGNADGLYGYRNSYRLMGSNSPRLRRQEMQADKSLNRVSIFFFCCFLLCLLVF